MSMSTSILKPALAGAGALLIAMLGALSPAAAKGKHHHHRHFHLWHAPLLVAPVDRGCGFYYAKWRETGRRFWKERYFACMS
jgi:hypothetical protein